MSVAARQMSSDNRVLERFLETVSQDLLTLAMLHECELDAERILAIRREGAADLLGLRLTGATARQALALLDQGLQDIPQELTQDSLDILAVEYADIYLNNSFGASPCESIWIDEDGLAMQEPMFQIRAFYRRHGLSAPDWRTRTDDHLVHQLNFLSQLLRPGAPEERLAEAARFADEHILRWIGEFAKRIAERCATRFYAGLAQLTAAYLDELRDILAEILAQPRPSVEEIDQRMQPKLSMAVAGPAAFTPGETPSW